jgi:integral membrane sensor domain MASE1
MRRIPRRYNHFVFSVIQSGLTCFIAAAIASLSFVAQGSFVDHWMKAWVVAWVTMLPVVLLAAPVIRRIADRLTGDDLD